jgi:hypothetical protein
MGCVHSPGYSIRWGPIPHRSCIAGDTKFLSGTLYPPPTRTCFAAVCSGLLKSVLAYRTRPKTIAVASRSDTKPTRDRHRCTKEPLPTVYQTIADALAKHPECTWEPSVMQSERIGMVPKTIADATRYR